MNAGSTINFVTAYKAMHHHENLVNATPFQQTCSMPVWMKHVLVLSPAERMRWFVCVPRFFLKSRRLCSSLAVYFCKYFA
jgi:hypothetical protein